MHQRAVQATPGGSLALEAVLAALAPLAPWTRDVVETRGARGGQPASLADVAAMPRDAQLAWLRRFLVAAALKDCSVFVAVAPASAADGADSTQAASGTIGRITVGGRPYAYRLQGPSSKGQAWRRADRAAHTRLHPSSIPDRPQWWMWIPRIPRASRTTTRWIKPSPPMRKACATACVRRATTTTVETHCTSTTVQTVHLYTLGHERLLVVAPARVHVARRRGGRGRGRGRRVHDGRVVHVGGRAGVASLGGRGNVAQEAAQQEDAAGLVQAVVLKVAAVRVDACKGGDRPRPAGDVSPRATSSGVVVPAPPYKRGSRLRSRTAPSA